MARTSYSRRKKRSEDIKGYIIIFISGIVLLCLFGVYFFVSKNTVVLTKDTLCPVDGPHGHTVFLIDRTDTYSKIQIAQIEKYLAQFQSEIPKHNELSIYDINSDPDNSLTPVFKMCNPGDGSDIDNWESLATNKNQIKQKYEEKFESKLRSTLDNMFDNAKTLQQQRREAFRASYREISGHLASHGEKPWMQPLSFFDKTTKSIF